MSTNAEREALRAEMQQLASAGMTAKQALAKIGLPRATFYRLSKQAGIAWTPPERSESTRQRHADSVRQTLMASGRALVIDVGDGPQTLRQVAKARGIPYSTLKYRYLNQQPLFQ